MTSGRRLTSTIAPSSVHSRRGRGRPLDFSSDAGTSAIFEIIKDAPMSLGLYVHLPFCRTHCSYCAFAISTDVGLQDEYVLALTREIQASGLGPRPSGQSSVLGPTEQS